MVSEMVVMSGDDGCWLFACGSLVCLSVLSTVCSLFVRMSEIIAPLWSFVCEFQSVECALMSPVMSVSGKLVR